MNTTEMIKAEIDEAVPVLARRLPEPGEVPGIMGRIEARPIRDTYFRASNIGRITGCCALTAAYVDRVPDGYSDVISADFLERGRIESGLSITPDFHVGATHGFDGEPEFASGSDDYCKGHTWGKAAWDACVEAGLAEDLQAIDSEVS